MFVGEARTLWLQSVFGEEKSFSIVVLHWKGSVVFDENIFQTFEGKSLMSKGAFSGRVFRTLTTISLLHSFSERQVE